MKKFIILFSTVLLILLIFTGCSNWGGNNPVGVTGGSEQGYGQGTGAGENINILLIGTWRHDYYSNHYEIITLSSNGTWDYKEYYYDILNEHEFGAFSVSGNTITVIMEGEEPFTVEFSINGDELTLTYPGEYPKTFYRV